MATFPASLPGPLIGTLNLLATDPWVGDPAEVGTDRRRARFTRELRSFSFTLRLTDAQKDTLKTFYETTLNKGVDAFTWTNPEDDVAYTVRFTKRPPLKNVSFNVWDAEVGLAEQ